MTAALAARGPDGEGFHFAPPVALGHRRLAIIDVLGGQQPLHSEDGNVTAVVNGEFYNFVALRDELQSLGHRFATRSDSEVLVHGYEEWGDAVVAKLEGMFAFCVYDQRRGRLLLARDRLGEKPLYYAELAGGGFAFASELTSLRHAPGLDCTIDPAALARYLVAEHVAAPRTILRGAWKLEPGTLLVLERGARPRLARYWDLPLPLPGAERITDAGEAATQLLAELRRAVRERLVSDVPLGVFLSGGIDSATIAALAAEVRGGDLDTFSIGFEDPEFDESAEARRVAQHLGTRHHEEIFSPRAALALLPSVGELLDEPLGDASIVPMHLLARFTRGHVTVALSGDGGDELFSGYKTFQAERVASWLFDRAPGFVGRASAAAGKALLARLPASGGYLPFDLTLRHFLRGAGVSGARRHQAWLAALLPDLARAALHPDVARAAGEDLLDTADRRQARCPSTDPWDRLLYHYAKGFLADGVLTKVDRATMAVGLESRAPLLDTGVVTLACRLAPELRMNGFRTKYLLRRAMRGLLPAETLTRKKQGFSMPLGRWLRGPLRGFLEETLSVPRLRATGLFEPAPIRTLVDEHITGKVDHRKPLFTVLAFLLWHERFHRS